MSNLLSLDGRTALIVGGTGGIGRAVALELARLHALVVVHGGHDASKGEQVLDQIRDSGGAARLIMQELHSMDDVSILGDAAAQADILVCAFGPFLHKPLHTMDSSEWRTMVDLNLALPGYMVSSALPRMVNREYGRILLFGGTGTDTIRGYTTVVAYSSAKMGLGVIAKSVAHSYAAKNVVCNVVIPGYVDTEYVNERDRAAWIKLSRTGRLQSAEVIARFAAQIVCNEDGVPNGAVIDLSAGMI